jgi:transketolase
MGVSPSVTVKPMRNAFADEVTQLAQADSRVVLLSGDIGNRLFDRLRAARPEQFMNCGVAEQNMMGVAAGMGLSGLRPIVYTITPFTTIRCLEQIKIDVGYHNSPVIIVGTGSGLSYASLGPTHHSLEDFAIFRAIPNLQVLAPWDAKSLRACLRMAIESSSPTYIRIGKKGETDLSGDNAIPVIGNGLCLKSGSQVCILATGTISSEAALAVKTLAEQGVSAELVLMHTVKSFSETAINGLLNRFDALVTVEEHSKVGGFGESVLSLIARSSLQKRIEVLGTSDQFMPVVGSQEYARQYFEIDADSIVRAALRVCL